MKEIGDLLTSNSEAVEFLNRMAQLNSPNGDIYGGKSADEILSEIDHQRAYKPDVYDCPICGNKGGKSEFNKVTKQSWWKSCSCMQNKKTMLNIEKSGLGELLNYRVKDFEVTNEFQRAMKETSVTYIRNAKKEWFLALGQPGCGKTMLCSAICNQRLKEGKVVKYIIWSEFMTTLKHMKYDQDRNDYYHEYLKSEVLYIDDMLKGKITDYERDLAFQIINHRYNNDLPTIISSELLVSDLRKLDEAMASRLYQKATKQFVLEIERDDNKNYRFK